MGRLQGRFFASSFKQETPGGAPDGTRVVFTLTAPPANPNALQLFLNGVLQTYITDYTLSGTTITMTTPPVARQELYATYVAAI